MTDKPKKPVLYSPAYCKALVLVPLVVGLLFFASSFVLPSTNMNPHAAMEMWAFGFLAAGAVFLLLLAYPLIRRVFRRTGNDEDSR